MKNKVMKLPSKPEQSFMGILNEMGSDFKYVGDGYTFIGGKCPDFINFKNKMIIEIFGSYYHQNGEEELRMKHFETYGYKTMVIWDYELKDTPSVKQKVLEFYNKNSGI